MRKRCKACVGAMAACAVLAVVFLAGCTGQADQVALPEGAAENEIVAYQPVDQGRMMLTVRTEYNGAPQELESILESRFPEVDFVFQLSASTAVNEFVRYLESDQSADLMFTWSVFGLTGEVMKDHLVDLSSKRFTTNYYSTALDGCSSDGALYFLPAPSSVNGIVYDKTLFDQYGWQVPNGLDEYIALCRTIKEETGLLPADFTFRWPSAISESINAWGYSSALEGNDNYDWLQAYVRGDASMVGHMEPMFDVLQKLIDGGVITEEAFSREPGDRSLALYSDHTTAMTNETQMAPYYAEEAGSTHEYAMMPYWGGNEPGSDYVAVVDTYGIAVNKAMEREENKEKYDKIMEVLDWLSTVEGQQALIGDQDMAASNVRGVPVQQGTFAENVVNTIEEGRMVPTTYYTAKEDSKAFYKTMHDELLGMVQGSKTAEDVMRACDAKAKELRESKEEKDPETVYATVPKTLSRLETGLYLADAFRRVADADVGLTLVGQPNAGSTSYLYQGDVTDASLKIVSFDTYVGSNEDYNKLAVATLTGEQIITLLESSFNDSHENQSTFTCYVASGLKVEYAPWAAKGEHLVSVTNEDGSQIDRSKTYKVAYWNGMLSEEKSWNNKSIEVPLAGVTPDKLYDEKFVELVAPIVQQDGVIVPFDDGRLVLNWDRVEG